KRAPPALESAIREMVRLYYESDLKAAEQALLKEKQFGTNASYLAARGFLKLVSGDDIAADGDFTKAHQADKSWALPLAHLSLTALVQNRRDDALALARRAAAAEPDSAVAMVALAYALKADLKLDEALEAAKKAVELAPDFDPALIVAARIALETEALGAAEDYLSPVAHNSPLLDQKLTLLGYIALRKSKVEEAESHFRQALELDPGSADAHLGLGIALFRQRDNEAGLDTMIKATLIDPQVSSYQSYLAKAYMELGRNNDAKKALTRAKRLDPKDPTPFLYEALIHQADYEMGKAFRALEEARFRNDNRAVFRSQYLLDQDRAVLTSNLAQVYNEIGFDHSATQEAARALELDPTNRGAHRRLFFALEFDPRGYDQASASERLLNNLFVPATRSAVVLDSDLISPYQNPFDQPGVDGVLKGRYEYTDASAAKGHAGAGNALVAAELQSPFAFSFDAGGSLSDLESPVKSTPETLSTGTTETDGYETIYRGFAKWQPTTNFETFLESRFNTKDSDSQALITRLRDPLDPMTEKQEVDSNFDIFDLDYGLHAKPGPDTHILVHLSYHTDDGRDLTDTTSLSSMRERLRGDVLKEMNMPPMAPTMAPTMPPGGSNPPPSQPTPAPTQQPSRTPQGGMPGNPTPPPMATPPMNTPPAMPTMMPTPPLVEEPLAESIFRKDQGFDFAIAQTALWQRVDQHFFQLGARYFSEDVMQREFSGDAADFTATDKGNDARLGSLFLVDQYTGVEDLVLTFALNYDDGEFEHDDGRTISKDNLGPSIGASWEVQPDMYIRAAYIDNMAGDRNERLQQTLVAGFPFQRLTTLDPYTAEEQFNLDYEAFDLAWDMYLHDPVVFIGAEIEYDKQSTRAFAMENLEEIESVSNDARRARFYVESLLTERLSSTFTYRFDRFTFTGETDRHGIDGTINYFFDFGMAAKFRAGMVRLIESAERASDSTVGVFEPSLEGYPFQRRLRLNLRFPVNTDGDFGAMFGFIWFL
ncbi:MAG: TonB-dependent receptor, partial [Deltaproteobacteria bacterium]|nr:TonB-dependent receptor [Deltaproteobacteria bacterium]